jgi:Fe-Mn family superoxide dismutase
MAFTLPDLPYAYDALEPHFDARTMEIHHGKHHAGYTKKANIALEAIKEKYDLDLTDKTACELLQNLDIIPAEFRSAVQNNVGGFCNHAFFWVTIKPNGGGVPVGALAEAISATFGDLETFKEKFSAAAKTRFGSGWAWLVIKDDKLEIISTANQDSPLSLGYKRVLGLDVWEHAYYLNYQNRRPDYVGAYWNVVNWEKANEFFEKGGI